jgi:hypothetical protein
MLQTHVAAMKRIASENAVLLTVPSIVIASARARAGAARKVSALRAGFPDVIASAGLIIGIVGFRRGRSTQVFVDSLRCGETSTVKA